MSTGYSEALAMEHEAPPMRPLTDKDHKNAHMLYTAHKAFQTGDINALFSQIAEDAIWHMPGENRLAGDYVGHEEIMRNFGMLQESVDAYYAYPLDYYGSDDHVTLIAEVRARKGDKVLHTKEAMTWRVENGQLKECWHLCMEPLKWDAFFSAD